MVERQVVVVGAGPAGLATAAELSRRGVQATVLERDNTVGSSWRKRYDRLTLNSSRWFSELPGGRFPRGTPAFPSRDQMVRYLEDYARRRKLDVWTSTPVGRIDRSDGGWALRTPAEDVHTEHVVVATGYDHTPAIPAWPGRDGFTGELLHVADYRNPRPFRGRDVLVVGPGCSGMEIAYDMACGGARRVRLAVRTPPNILIRTPPGPLFALLLLRLPPARGDAVVNLLRRIELGDLTPYGLPRPAEGVFSRLRRLGVAPSIIDTEVVDAVKDGRIEIVAGLQAFDGEDVVLNDGTRIQPDAVIAATGYRRGLETLVGHLGVVTADGTPTAHADRPAAPGLWFVGFVPRPAQLGYSARQAKRVAAAIATQLADTPSARRRYDAARVVIAARQRVTSRPRTVPSTRRA